jgi:hypothetical protein
MQENMIFHTKFKGATINSCPLELSMKTGGKL